MDKLSEFIANHWELCAALALIIVLIILEESRHKSGGKLGITAQEATNKMNRENAVLVDTRDNEAFAKGHIIGAVNIPYKELMDDAGDKKLIKFKKKPIVFACYKGVSSLRVAEKFHAKGMSVFSLAGGMDGWRNSKLPLNKPKS